MPDITASLGLLSSPAILFFFVGAAAAFGYSTYALFAMTGAQVAGDADGVMHITMTNLDLEHAYPIETTILGKKVESIKAQIVTQEMHAKNTFEDPENVTVQSFEGVEKVHAGIKFTIPACSVLHIALK